MVENDPYKNGQASKAVQRYGKEVVDPRRQEPLKVTAHRNPAPPQGKAKTSQPKPQPVTSETTLSVDEVVEKLHAKIKQDKKRLVKSAVSALKKGGERYGLIAAVAAIIVMLFFALGGPAFKDSLADPLNPSSTSQTRAPLQNNQCHQVSNDPNVNYNFASRIGDDGRAIHNRDEDWKALSTDARNAAVRMWILGLTANPKDTLSLTSGNCLSENGIKLVNETHDLLYLTGDKVDKSKSFVDENAQAPADLCNSGMAPNGGPVVNNVCGISGDLSAIHYYIVTTDGRVIDFYILKRCGNPTFTAPPAQFTPVPMETPPPPQTVTPCDHCNPPPVITCPNGQLPDQYGNCGPPIITCPNGQLPDVNGNCGPPCVCCYPGQCPPTTTPPTPTPCPPGTNPNPNGVCVVPKPAQDDPAPRGNAPQGGGVNDQPGPGAFTPPSEEQQYQPPATATLHPAPPPPGTSSGGGSAPIVTQTQAPPRESGANQTTTVQSGQTTTTVVIPHTSAVAKPN